MKWFTDFMSSSLGRKFLMSLTGVFLISFLTVHLIGNLQLLTNDGGRAFNLYADFMSNNMLIQTVSKVNFLIILVHIVWGVTLVFKNKKSRGGQGYAQRNSPSPWTSRNMGVLGTFVFVFLVVHLRHFYAEIHWGSVSMVNYGDKEVSDVHHLVSLWFDKGWYVALYVVCMVALSFHLWHGFASAFQTLGMNHIKYNALINVVGKVFSVLVPALFAAIPLTMFLT